jgi:hypothetical protein
VPSRIARLFATFAVLCVIAPSLAVAQQTAGEAAWPVEVRRMLDRRAAAVLAGDERTFQETMAAAPAAFKRERLTWLRRLRALPLGTYRLDFPQDEYAELTRAADRRRHPKNEVHVIQVKERIGFRGYDAAPQAEDLFLTVVKDAKGWSVASDDDAEPLALQSQRSLWDIGPVEKVEGGGVMVIYHPAQRSAAKNILSMSIAAKAKIKKLWPIPWHSDRIVLMIPSTVNELARLLQTTFDLSTFVAFAAVSVDRKDGDFRLAGARVFLHWPNFRRQGAASQRLILQHEFLHRASFQAFNDEGIAQYYGEEAYSPPLPELRLRIASGRFTKHVPADYFFSVGPPPDIYLAYEEAVSFAAYVGIRFGRPAAAKLYRAVGTHSGVSPGTTAYHLDAACRALFGVSFATLERDWARSVLKRSA